jgi:hypothetical protein
MKNILSLFQIGLLSILISCTKHTENSVQNVTCNQFSDYNERYNWINDSLSKNDTCTKFQSIWKDLFLEKNNLSQKYFDDHIIPYFSSYGAWDEGMSFNICYKIRIDWAIAYSCDQFIIKIRKGNNLYPALILPRDTLLSIDNIRIAIKNRAFSSSVTVLSNDEVLKFSSNKSAMDNLIRASNLNTLCFNNIYIDRFTGHMMIEADAQYVNKFNSCVQGFLDLINGNSTFENIPCAIN